jgi:hypothetical protein
MIKLKLFDLHKTKLFIVSSLFQFRAAASRCRTLLAGNGKIGHFSEKIKKLLSVFLYSKWRSVKFFLLGVTVRHFTADYELKNDVNN